MSKNLNTGLIINSEDIWLLEIQKNNTNFALVDEITPVEKIALV